MPSTALHLLRPSGQPRGAVLVIPSCWGRTPSFADYAGRLAAAGFSAGVSDIHEGRTARTEAEARELKAARRREPVYKGLLRDIEALRAETGAERIGVVGFSKGAHWAVWLSQQAGNRVASAVLYYCARGGDFSASRAAYLAHFAEADAWVSRTARAGMERALARAGRPYLALDYPGTGHWFAESDRARDYVPEAAERAFAETVAHFGRTLA